MAVIERAEALSRSDEIRDETSEHANTATRVGQLLHDIAQSVAFDADSGPITITTDSTTARTLAIGDAEAYLRFTNAAAVAVTIPTNASVAFPIGTRIVVRQAGDGPVTITPAGGVTLESNGTLTTLIRGVSRILTKVATNTWDLSGEVGPFDVSVTQFESLVSSGNWSPAFEAAIDYVGSGGQVFVPKGTYGFNAPVELGDNIHVVGSKGSKILKSVADTELFWISGDNSSISGLELDGNNQAERTLLLITGAYNKVFDCWLHDNGDVGSPGAYTLASHGISLDGQSTDCYQNRIYNNRVEACHDIGISQNDASDNRICDNVISGCGLEGVTIDVNSHRCKVSRNDIVACCVNGGVGGIGIDGSDLCIISENHIIGTASGLSGIKSQNNTGASSYNVVTNNVILDNGGWGIWLFNGTSGAALYWTVTGNVVRGNTTGSIRLESGSDNNQVRANSLNGVAASDAGASNTIN